jgi:hypothetical protein
MNVVAVVGGGRPIGASTASSAGVGPAGSLAGPLPVTLSMYSEPPHEEVTLDDFEVLAFERLRGELLSGLRGGGGGGDEVSLQPCAMGRGARPDAQLPTLRLAAVLKKLEDCRQRGLKPPEANKVLADTWRGYMAVGSDAERARKDTVSHHILRLAYCNSEDNRRWFLTHEVALFK